MENLSGSQPELAFSTISSDQLSSTEQPSSQNENKRKRSSGTEPFEVDELINEYNNWEELVNRAVSEYKPSVVSFATLSKKYNIPQSTISNHYYRLRASTNPRYRFGEEEEQELVIWIKQLYSEGANISCADIRRKATQLARRSEPHKTTFSRSWFLAFQKRHPELNHILTKLGKSNGVQLLSREEELEIVRWVTQQNESGETVNPIDVRNLATEYVRRKDPNKELVTKSWFKGFRNRHPEIATKERNRKKPMKNYFENPEDETTFLKWLQEQSQTNPVIPLTAIRKSAGDIMKKKNPKRCPPSFYWIQDFLKSHPELNIQLQTSISIKDEEDEDLSEDEMDIYGDLDRLSYSDNSNNTSFIDLEDASAYSPSKKRLRLDGEVEIVEQGSISKPKEVVPIEFNEEDFYPENCEDIEPEVAYRGNPLATAEFSYEANDPKKISLQAGNTLLVFDQDESGWWYGKNLYTNLIGWFPSNFVRLWD